jgi:hypothetical protein
MLKNVELVVFGLIIGYYQGINVHVLIMFQILMFDSIRRRTCLHYAAYYGHVDCLKTILSSAHSSPVADSWLVTISWSPSMAVSPNKYELCRK